MDRKSVKVELNVWYDAETGRIKLVGGGFRSAISNDRTHKRYHPNLYRKLGNLLREAGAPAPGTAEDK